MKYSYNPYFGVLNPWKSFSPSNYSLQTTTGNPHAPDLRTIISQAVDYHLEQVEEFISQYCDITDNYQYVYPPFATRMVMEYADENGLPHPQVQRMCTTLGIPLYKMEGRLIDPLTFPTIGDVLEAYITLFESDWKCVYKQFKEALFNPCNRDFTDYLVDHKQLAIKALINADGRPIPIGFEGSIFNPETHTHYLYNHRLDLNSIRELYTNVTEHIYDSNIRILISEEDIVEVSELISSSVGCNKEDFDLKTLDYIPEKLNQPNERNTLHLGNFNDTEIYVCPFIPKGYLLAININKNGPKLLTCRIAPWLNKITSVIEDEYSYPMKDKNKYLIRIFGIALKNRHEASILNVTHNGCYTYDGNIEKS